MYMSILSLLLIVTVVIPNTVRDLFGSSLDSVENRNDMLVIHSIDKTSREDNTPATLSRQYVEQEWRGM